MAVNGALLAINAAERPKFDTNTGLPLEAAREWRARRDRGE